MSVAPTYLCHQAPPQGAPQPVPPPMPGELPEPGVRHEPDHLDRSQPATSSSCSRPNHAARRDRSPVLFMWHWIGGGANSFLEKRRVRRSRSAALHRGDPERTRARTWTTDLVQHEVAVRHHAVALAHERGVHVLRRHARVRRGRSTPVDQNCVSTVGVSAGALFTDQLAQARGTGSRRSCRCRAASATRSSGRGPAPAPTSCPASCSRAATARPTWTATRTSLAAPASGWTSRSPRATLETRPRRPMATSSSSAATTAGTSTAARCPRPASRSTPACGSSRSNHPFWLPAGQSPFLDHGLPADMPSLVRHRREQRHAALRLGLPRRRESLRRVGRVIHTTRTSCV